jgi:hypothetical protein
MSDDRRMRALLLVSTEANRKYQTHSTGNRLLVKYANHHSVDEVPSLRITFQLGKRIMFNVVCDNLETVIYTRLGLPQSLGIRDLLERMNIPVGSRLSLMFSKSKKRIVVDGDINIIGNDDYYLPLPEKIGLEIFNTIVDTIKLTFMENA